MDTFVFLSLVLSAVLTCIFHVLWRHQQKKNYWQKRGVPEAPGSVPVFGHMLPVMLQRISSDDLVNEIYTNFDKHSVVGYYKMNSPVLLIRSPELVRAVLQVEFSSFHDNKVVKGDDPLLAKNPFFSNGEAWALSRKRWTYAFSILRLKKLAETARGVSEKLIEYVDGKMGKDDAVEIELKDLFSRFTAETVASVAFGAGGRCFTDEKFSGSIFKVVQHLFQPSLAKFVKLSMLSFLPSLSRLLKVRIIAKNDDRFFRKIMKEIIQIRREERAPRNDFFQLITDLELAEGKQVDEETLMSYVFSFFVDGIETSSITLTLAGYLIASHPHVQRKLHEEVSSVLAKHDGIINYDSLKDMVYLDQVLKESLRMFPAGGVMVKVCTRDIELTDADGRSYKVERGTEIVIPQMGLQNDPKYWQDPELFDPDRFSNENKRDINKFTYIPFGEGPRNCVAMRMAQTQMKAALAAVLSKYTMQISPKMQLPMRFDPKYFLPSPVGGTWINLVPHSRVQN